MIKLLFIILGTISLGFGILGIVLPGLPTTPFLLLSAGLYLKGSDKFYNVLIQNRVFGPYISKFREDKGMTLRTKFFALLLMWTMIIVSANLIINDMNIDILLYIVGAIGTIIMGFVISTVNPSNMNKH